MTTPFVDAGDAPEFFVSDRADFGIGTRLFQQSLACFLIAAFLYVVSYLILFGA